jgi:hypothetical protein
MQNAPAVTIFDVITDFLVSEPTPRNLSLTICQMTYRHGWMSWLSATVRVS